MTIRRNYSNTATATTITSSITAASTSFTVAAASGYPAVPFTVVLESEVVLVEDRSGTVFSGLTRGYDGTSASTHASGTTVEHRAIADDFDWRWVDVLTQDDTETVYDDEFDDGVTSAWSQVTPTGTATWTEARGKLAALYTGQTANDCCANLTSLNGLSYPLYVVTAARMVTPTANYSMFGPVFTDGTTTGANAMWFMPFYNTTFGLTASLRSGTLTNISTTHYDSNHASYAPWLFLRLDWVTTNTWRAWVSTDGVAWSSMNQNNVTFAMTPSHYGLGVSSWSGTGAARQASFDMFRVYTAKPSYWIEL